MTLQPDTAASLALVVIACLSLYSDKQYSLGLPAELCEIK